MIAVAGHLAILVGLGAAVSIVVQGIRYHKSGSKEALRVPVLVYTIAGVLAFAILQTAILTHDFSIAYVANNTSVHTPFMFLIASAWAALEGSIVLWGLVLVVMTYLAWRSLEEKDGLGVLALAVIGAVGVFWFGVMASPPANPFAVCTEVVNGICNTSSWWPLAASVAPLDGQGPNSLLQNHWLMALHPPTLYIGFVGFTIPFGFAIAALWRRDTGRAWLDRTHRWSLVSWTFLFLGILLGAWWAYEVLGWGGYWTWDPVENASLLPMLTATAFIHTAVVQRKRGMLQSWNFILVIATFALTIFATFLTRAGLIMSVHAFSQSTIGPWLLAFLVVIVVGSLTLFAFRANDISQAPRMDSLSSREGYILANNLILVVFAFTVLFGTMFPLIVQAVSGDEVAIGRMFFDRATVPIGLLLLLVLGLGAVAPWRVASPQVLWKRLRAAIAIGIVSGAIAVAIGVNSLAVVLTIVLGIFVISAIGLRFVELARKRPEGLFRGGAKLFRNDLGYWGGQVAHTGLAILAISIATTSGLAIHEHVTLSAGETAVVDGHCIQYIEPFAWTEPHRHVQGVAIAVLDYSCTEVRAILYPSLNTFPRSIQPIGTPDVWTGLIDDVYVAIAGGTMESIELNVFIFPLQWLLWVGGFIIVAGGAISLGRSDTRRSRPVEVLEKDSQEVPRV